MRLICSSSWTSVEVRSASGRVRVAIAVSLSPCRATGIDHCRVGPLLVSHVVSVRVLYDTQARRIRHRRAGRNQNEAVTRPKLQHPATRAEHRTRHLRSLGRRRYHAAMKAATYTVAAPGSQRSGGRSKTQDFNEPIRFSAQGSRQPIVGGSTHFARRRHAPAARSRGTSRCRLGMLLPGPCLAMCRLLASWTPRAGATLGTWGIERAS